MKCQHCQRDVGATHLRCPTCRQKLIWWYLLFVIILIALFTLVWTVELPPETPIVSK